MPHVNPVAAHTPLVTSPTVTVSVVKLVALIVKVRLVSVVPTPGVTVSFVFVPDPADAELMK
jgi:hypothetical protein